ncbi:DUF2634 domain-containing protein [Paenibacillus sp. GCM10027626]|uniref:DUF2634 domain-containing protein n=1 Tax=Paenibacillus sp. GCM10027626 TaxID=3273411 RepID=UPI0036266926
MTIPIGSIADHNQEITAEPSRTYRLDPASGRISGHIDGIEAVRQAVFKILRTERFAHVIYSGDFGHDIRQSGDFSYQLEGWIHDALTQDDRIDDITDFKLDISGDQALIQFTVVSAYGRFNISERRDTADV